MNFTIFDIETDGLIENATKIHCLSFSIVSIIDSKTTILSQGSLSDYKQMKTFILLQTCLVGHNIIRFDIPVLEKILNIKIEARLIDTLGLSWYLTPSEINSNGLITSKKNHGLETWGEFYNVPKPEIEDWKGLKLEDYIHRCEEDVKINSLLWRDQFRYILNLYEDNLDNALRAISYIGFKLDCIREQEENPLHIDKEMCEQNLIALIEEIEIKTSELVLFMPLNKKYKVVKRPKVFYKKDGTLSVAGERWLNWMKEYDLPSSTETFNKLDSVEEGNPNSPIQIKDWLLSLGWKPTIIKEATSKVTGITTYNPQLTNDDKEFCPNLVRMFKKYPYLKNLENLTLMVHRKGVFESFLDNLSPDNTVQATIGGLANTLRFRHKKPIVNLPKVRKYLGKEIRGLIVTSNDDFLICGSDVHSLEDSTKQHFMFFFDPEYVQQMRVPGFDPHVDIAVRANIMTEQEADRYKFLKTVEKKTQQELEEYEDLDLKRYNSKTGNFASVYGAGVPKLTKVLDCTLDFAYNFHTAYWIRNKAVKDISNNTITKKIGGQLWLYNPVSCLWYSLRVLKDIFSVLNQGTGAYVEDRWIFNMRKKGLKMSLQMHDEVALYLKKEDREKVSTIINESMEAVNEELNLNVPISVSLDFGNRYSEIH